MNTKQKESAKAKIVTFLSENGATLPGAIVKGTGIAVEDAKPLVKEMIEEGVLRPNSDNPKMIEVVPVKKKAPAKAKAKPEPEEEDEWEEDEVDEVDEDEDEVDEEEVDEDEVDEDDPEEEDEVDDDEDDEPAKPAPKGKKPAPKAPAPHKAFTMAFKPIDTLTDKELLTRVTDGVNAAETAHEEGFLEVAEMLMRSVARARKQLNKRA